MQKDGYGNLFCMLYKIRHANIIVLSEQVDSAYLFFLFEISLSYSFAFSSRFNLVSHHRASSHSIRWPFFDVIFGH